MKRTAAAVLLLALLLCACSDTIPVNGSPVTFYYPRINLVYGAEDGVIVPEVWVYATERPPLETVLSAYLAGPSNPELTSPFPAGTKLVKYAAENTDLILTMSDSFFTLEGTDFSLACACLVMTCHELTGASEIILNSDDGAKKVVFSPESFVFTDSQDSIEMTLGTEAVQN